MAAYLYITKEQLKRLILEKQHDFLIGANLIISSPNEAMTNKQFELILKCLKSEEVNANSLTQEEMSLFTNNFLVPNLAVPGAFQLNPLFFIHEPSQITLNPNTISEEDIANLKKWTPGF